MYEMTWCHVGCTWDLVLRWRRGGADVAAPRRPESGGTPVTTFVGATRHGEERECAQKKEGVTRNLARYLVVEGRGVLVVGGKVWRWWF